MTRLDRFLLTAFLGPFFAVLGIVVFILVMQFLWLYIDELVGKGLGLKVVLEFLMWGGCQALPLAFPLATLLSSVMTMGRLGEQFELTAIKASGISLQRVMLPMTGACLLIVVAAFFVGDRLVPRSWNELFTMRDDIGRTKSEIKIPTGVFYDGIEGYILRVGSRDKQTGMMHHIQIYDHTNRRGNASVTVADSGVIQISKSKDYLVFRLYDGVNHRESNTFRHKDTTLALQRIFFSRQDLVIPLSNYAFHHSDSVRFGEQLRTMGLSALHKEQDSLRTVVRRSTQERVREFLSRSQWHHGFQLDTAWLAKGASPMPMQQGWSSAQRKASGISAAASAARELKSAVQGMDVESMSYRRRFSKTGVEIWKKYSQALACLLLFFIGMPVGALLKKGGFGAPAIVSMLFFLLYYVVDITGERLANNGRMAPFAGKFISAFLLAPMGAFFCLRATQDSSLFQWEGFSIAFRRARSKFFRFFRKTRIVFMGTPEFSVASLDALLQAGHHVVAVVTAPDKPSGRGLRPVPSPVKAFALERGLAVMQPEKLRDEGFLSALSALKADLFVVVGFRMLPEVVWSMPRLGTFNLHAALLPQYRGAAPIHWAVINGEHITGVTTFMIDRQIDTGGIIFRSECRIQPDDTAGTLHDRLMPLGATLVAETVEALVQRNVELRVQRSFIQGTEVLKPAPKLTPALQHLDWDDSAEALCRLILGLSPWPGAYTQLSLHGGTEVRTLKVLFARRRDDLPPASPGTVLTDGKTYFCVAARDGAVSLEQVQLEGKRGMGIRDFLAGFREAAGCAVLQGTSRRERERLTSPSESAPC